MRLCILFFLVIVPLIGASQITLQREWIKPMAGTGEFRNLQSLDGNGNIFVMAGDIAITDTAFGCAYCASGVTNAWLLSDDINGNKIYSHCYGGSAADGFQGACFDKSSYIWAIGGFSSTDGDFPNPGSGTRLAVVKFDSAYHPLWYQFYGSNGENDLGDFITTSDGGALILASTNDTSGDIHYLYGGNGFNFNAYLCKLDSAGNVKWILILGGSGYQYPWKLKEIEPGKYTALINTNSIDYSLAGINFDSVDLSPWLVVVDTGGNILSSRVVPNMANFDSRDFTTISTGGLFLAGATDPLTDSDICYPGLGLSDFGLVSINSFYQRQWCAVMGGSDNDYIDYMLAINDSVVALCGHSQSTNGGLSRCEPFGYSVYHGWLGLVNTNTRQLTWQTSFCDSVNVSMVGLSYDSPSQSLYALIAGGVGGDFASAAISGTTNNTYLFKYSLINTTGIDEFTKTNASLSLYPNPASNDCMLKIDAPYQMNIAVIYDAVGRQVMPLFNNQQINSFNFSCNNLSSGLYFIKVTDSEGRVGVVKLVKE